MSSCEAEGKIEDVSVSPISRLPPELLACIFRHCSVPDLALSVQHVCLLWRLQVLSPDVWHTHILEICVDKRKLQHYRRILSQVPLLRAARFSGPEDVIPELWQKCHDLQWLRLSHCSTEQMQNLLLNLHHLRHLDLCVKFKSDVESVFYQLESSPLTLHVLILRQCEPAGTLPLQILEVCPYLQHLLISKFQELDPYVDSVASLSSKDITVNRVETIYFVGCMLLSKDFLFKLTELHHLQCLTLRFNKFTQTELQETVFSKQYYKLIAIDLGYSYNLDSSIIDVIALHCAQIRNLSLVRCAMTDEGFYELMKRFSKLQVLNLHGTLVTSEKLSELPQYLPHLKYLNLDACRRVNLDSVKSLVKALPNLLVLKNRNSHVAGVLVKSCKSPFLAQRNCL